MSASISAGNLTVRYSVQNCDESLTPELVSRALAVFDGRAHKSFAECVDTLIRYLLTLPQTELPVKHRFSPGLYMREISMPAGTIVIGKKHKTEHFNILMTGACILVHEDFTRELLRAPCVFVSKAGVQKVLLILEDMIWMTTHVTDETDLAKIEALVVEPLALLEKQP